uniref:Uncharacterized protein n=1 Tax=Anguilla anguilla TaxID=7936 RepID=A0A0E9RED7_ANGAN
MVCFVSDYRHTHAHKEKLTWKFCRDLTGRNFLHAFRNLCSVAPAIRVIRQSSWEPLGLIDRHCEKLSAKSRRTIVITFSYECMISRLRRCVGPSRPY